jgi:hypothetical protein
MNTAGISQPVIASGQPIIERFVVLDQASEAKLLQQNTRELLRISAADCSALQCWCDETVASPCAPRHCGAWAAVVLKTGPSLIDELSPSLYRTFSERLLQAAGEQQRHVPVVCMEVLDWVRESPPMPLVDHCNALVAILPGNLLPLVWIDSGSSFTGALELGDKLACAGMPIALRSSPLEWNSFVVREDWSRCATRWREAKVFALDQLHALSDNPVNKAEEYLSEKAPATLPLLQSAREQVALASAGGVSWEKARSAAERLLAEVLNARPSTQGRFGLDQSLDFPFGTRPLEADLADLTSRIVIEIDGYYHFNDPESYRRDRRKDLALQQHGWLVLRFLADDVVKDIGSVVQQIEQVAARRDIANPIHNHNLCSN